MIRANTTPHLGRPDEPPQEVPIWEKVGEWLFRDKEVAASEARVASAAVDLHALLGTVADMDGALEAERAMLQASEAENAQAVAEVTQKNAQLRMDAKRLAARAEEQEGYLEQERERRDALEQQLEAAERALEARDAEASALRNDAGRASWNAQRDGAASAARAA